MAEKDGAANSSKRCNPKFPELRLPRYISPSALSVFRRSDQTEFFIRYLCMDRPDRPPQTEPMSVGSAFDAYVKWEISQALGIECDRDGLFEEQVEPHNRDFARDAGEVCMLAYKVSGALADVLSVLKEAEDVDMDLVGEGTITVGDGTCVLYGKPDLKFVIDGNPVMLDWKVNGYCSKSNTSPTRGFIKCRDGWVGKQSRSHNTAHKDALVAPIAGIRCNVAEPFDDLYPAWAMQVAPYGWMCGIPVGMDHPAIIHQLACGPAGVRVAQHAGIIGADYQRQLATEYCDLWNIVHDPYAYWGRPQVEQWLNLAKQYKADEDTPEGKIFAELTRVN